MIYVTGDMHGSLKKLTDALTRCKKGDTLLIAGDFGFLWDGTPDEKKQLVKIGKSKVNICFIDGSNENYDLLSEYPVTEVFGGKAANISGNLWYLQRGEVYLIEDKKIFCFGGAKSDSIDSKQAEGKWYTAELPTKEQMKNGYDRLKEHDFQVDFILTHQPSGSILASIEDGYIDCDSLQIYLDEIAKNITFTLWIFGRLHRDRKITYKHTAVFNSILPLNPKPPKRSVSERK